MIALALLLAALWITAGFGRALIGRRGIFQRFPLDRFVFSAALGLGIAAYCIFFLGLLGQLRFVTVTCVWLAMAGVGYRGIIDNSKDLIDALRRSREGIQGQGRFTPTRLLIFGGAVTLLLFGGIAALACFKPPTGYEWDAIAYHLADPKIFLNAHRIVILPTEHHSNFPLLMEMLFLVGLLYDGYALAGLFHFLTGALTVLAMIAFCGRNLNRSAGWIAAILFVSTPIVLWEASVAYIDLGMGLFVTLATFAAVNACGKPAPAQDDAPEDRQSRVEWAMLAGLMMGFALGTKYLALVPFGLLTLFLAFRLRSWRPCAIYIGLALVLASPWYIKNTILMKNPVYPYFFRLFPESRYWSADRAQGYETEQQRFGAAHSLKEPVTALRNLLQAPFDLVISPERYANAPEVTFMAMVGGLYAAFNILLFFRRRLPLSVRDLAAIGLLQFGAWFFTAQVSRYLISILPVLAVTGGYAVSAWFESDRSGEGQTQAPRTRFIGVAPILALIGQVAVTLYAVFALPTHNNETHPTQLLTALSVPEVIASLTDPGGPTAHLRRSLDTYRVVEWINSHVPAGEGILLYDDVRGFYLDRTYLWANAEHSSYIPYDSFHNAQEMTDWMVRNHDRYAMIDMNNFSAGRPESDRFNPNGREAEALDHWYAVAAPGAPRYRVLIAEAIRNGLWTAVPVAQHGVALLHTGPSDPGAPPVDDATLSESK